MRSLAQIFGFFIIVLSCASCAQLSQFQSARTVGKDKITVGGTLSGYGLLDSDPNSIVNDFIILPYVVGRMSYGLTNKTDLSASLSSGGNINLSGKFQIIGDDNSPWVVSLEPGAGVQFVPNNNEVFTRFRIQAPVSHFMQNNNSLTLEPAFILQVGRDSDSYYFGGTSLSYQIPLNEKLILGFGGSYFYPFTESQEEFDSILFNVGGGLQYWISR